MLNKKTIKQVQEALNLVADGIAGPKTKAAVLRFQQSENLVADGIIGRKTLEALGILDSDAKSNSVIATEHGLKIIKNHMPEGEYISYDQPIVNDYLFLHTTFGWENPFNQIHGWANDKRGRVGTEFVVGGQNIKTGDDSYDGVVLQAFPEGSQGWHLGNTGSYYMNRHSVGIELCNFGYLNKYDRNWVNVKAAESQIAECLFRGHSKYHKISSEQLKATKKLIEYIASRDSIDVTKGLIQWIHEKGADKAFEFQQDAYEGKVKGLLSHSNVRKDKQDIHPQDELIDMLLSI